MTPAQNPSRGAGVRGYLARMHLYFSEMFPLPAHGLVAALTYLDLAVFTARASGVSLRVVSWHTVAGMWTIFNVFLLLRLMDELKDRDIDKVLFPSRPLPSGRVLEADIRITLCAAIAAFVLVGFCAGTAIWSAFVVLGYLLLMFRLFFVPELLRHSLPLALATHAPIVPLLLVHGVTIFADGQAMISANCAGR